VALCIVVLLLLIVLRIVPARDARRIAPAGDTSGGTHRGDDAAHGEARAVARQSRVEVDYAPRADRGFGVDLTRTASVRTLAVRTWRAGAFERAWSIACAVRTWFRT
jgi:hypothetical protein